MINNSPVNSKNIKLVEFKKAVIKLEQALREPKNEFIRDSVIQRFEFSVELAWKTGKKMTGISTSAPKDVIRDLAQSGYILDLSLWLEAIDMRNLSSHTYNEDLADKLYDFAIIFLPSLKKLVEIFDEKLS